VAVGRGHLDAPSVALLLDRPCREGRLPTAPAHGLHQWAVSYEDPGPGLWAVAEAGGSSGEVTPAPEEEPPSR
jgi:hypothetical protein